MLKHPRVLLLTPPMVQFNTPYSATPWLTAFLRREGIPTFQADLSLELALALFSRGGLVGIIREIRRSRRRQSEAVRSFMAQSSKYVATVDDVIRFLQAGDRRVGRRLVARAFPEGPRFRILNDLAVVGHDPAVEDPAMYPYWLASLYVDDLADVVREGVDPRFGLSRYAERLATGNASFTPMLRALKASPTLVDGLLDRLTLECLERVKPDLVGVTIPFPGNVYAAFRIARKVKAWDPHVQVVAGGGVVNTEWRQLSDRRVFDFLDYVVEDDGEVPLLRLAQYLGGAKTRDSLVKTRLRTGRKIIRVDSGEGTIIHRNRPPPDYTGLALQRYCAIVETPNPMHRLWTERRWIKLALAHGCYWHRCAFCDTSLDYISRFDPADADTVVGWIAEVKRKTGQSGFHFVDEAAPPALLDRLAGKLIERQLKIEWWTNIRFESAFTPALAARLARSGCIAVTGGLECADPRLLSAMNKGTTLRQAACATNAFSRAGILVHSYLMYGFPGETVQETVDALEYVRQLFKAGCIQSAFWHRFALTVHSPMYRSPRLYGIRRMGKGRGSFALNEVPFSDGKRVDHDALGNALYKAVYNYMQGVGLDEDVRKWFSCRVPRPRLRPSSVAEWTDMLSAG